MALDTSQVYYGVSRIFRDEYDATGAAADFPDPNTAGKFAPAGTWVELGLSQDNFELRAEVTYGEILSDQLVDPVARPVESRDAGISGNLMEFTPENMQYALGVGTTDTQAPGAGAMGYSEFVLDDDVSEELAMILVDYERPGNGLFGRLLIPKAKPISSVTTTFGARTAATLIPFDFAALPHSGMATTTTFVFRNYTPASS